MTFSCAEAEQILRELWDDAEQVGGFANDWHRVQKIEEMREEYGAVVDCYTLIGNVSWSGYEEGADYTLWVKNDDGTLWFFEAGHTVYGDFGEDFNAEVYPATMEAWLSYVESCADLNDSFVGC